MNYNRLKLFVFLVVYFVFMGATAVAQQDPSCKDIKRPPLLSSGGFYLPITYRYIDVDIEVGSKPIRPEILAKIMSQLTIRANSGIPAHQSDCSAESHIDGISPVVKAGHLGPITVRIDGTCESNEANSQFVYLQLMREIILQIAKIPGVKIDPNWDKQPPCLGGGATGSN